MHAHFIRLIETLAQDYGANIIASEDRIEYTLEAGDFLLMFHYLKDAQQMLLATSVAALPEKNREDFFFELLNGQYFFKETQGMTLSVDNDRTFIMLETAPYLSTVTTDNFHTLVENFLQTADKWRMRAQAWDSRENSNESESVDSSPLPEMMTMLQV